MDWAGTAQRILGACSCHEAYKSRGMTAPDCVWCDCSAELIEALNAAYAAGLDASGGGHIIETTHYAIDAPASPPEGREAELREIAQVVARHRLWRDTYPDGPEMLDGPVFITPAEIRKARALLTPKVSP